MSSFKELFLDFEIDELKSNVFQCLKDTPEVLEFIQELWENNFHTFGLKDSAKGAFESIKNNFLVSDLDYNNLFTNTLKTQEYKKHRRKSFLSAEKMDFQYSLLESYLQNASSFLDFGSGKLATLRKICSNNQNIQKLYGFDPNSNPRFTSSDPRISFITKLKDLKNLKDLDIIYSSLVLHHLTPEELDQSLKVIFNCLKSGGKFILIEEGFPEELDEELLKVSHEKLNSFGYSMNEQLVAKFENFTDREKFLVIYFNDYLINLGNLNYMPWTFEYRDLDSWVQLVEEYNFKLEEKYYFGIIKNKARA